MCGVERCSRRPYGTAGDVLRALPGISSRAIFDSSLRDESRRGTPVVHQDDFPRIPKGGGHSSRREDTRIAQDAIPGNRHQIHPSAPWGRLENLRPRIPPHRQGSGSLVLSGIELRGIGCNGIDAVDADEEIRAGPTGRRPVCFAPLPGFHPGLFSIRPSGTRRLAPRRRMWRRATVNTGREATWRGSIAPRARK
jgi:hypothetical protein